MSSMNNLHCLTVPGSCNFCSPLLTRICTPAVSYFLNVIRAVSASLDACWNRNLLVEPSSVLKVSW